MKKILIIFVLAVVTSVIALAQTVQIRGTVTNSEDGLGMPGVMVSVKGTMVGTLTDADGNYSLNVPVGSKTLVLSYVGMKKQEIDITGKNSVFAIMEPDTQMMDEIVVVGYGVQNRRDVSGAIATIKGDAIKLCLYRVLNKPFRARQPV